MVKVTSSIPILAMAAICWLVPAGVVAKERPWFKYENAYFEAYSDASERKVRRLLKELENFRAAVIQTLNIQAPDNYVKTQVIIIDSRSDFKEIASAAHVAAYMQRIGGIPHIVMPDSDLNMDAEALIRHEYAHVLLDFNRFDYP